MGAAIGALFMLAASFGLSRAIERYDLKKLQENPTARDLQAIANAIFGAASTKGNAVVNQLADRINSITMPFGISSAAGEYVAKVKSHLSEKKREAEKLRNDIDTVINRTQGTVQAHEMLSTSGKTSGAGREYERQAMEGLSQVTDLAKGYDKIENQV